MGFSIEGSEQLKKQLVSEAKSQFALDDSDFALAYSDIINFGRRFDDCILAEDGWKILTLGARGDASTHYVLPKDHDKALEAIGKFFHKSTGSRAESPPVQTSERATDNGQPGPTGTIVTSNVGPKLIRFSIEGTGPDKKQFLREAEAKFGLSKDDFSEEYGHARSMASDFDDCILAEEGRNILTLGSPDEASIHYKLPENYDRALEAIGTFLNKRRVSLRVQTAKKSSSVASDQPSGLFGKILRTIIGSRRDDHGGDTVVSQVRVGDIVTTPLGMKLTLLPAGEFLMGSVGYYHEAPLHRVAITTPFFVGIYPVTQEEYKRVMGTAPDHLQGDDCLPVHHISWYDAVEFCNAVSRKEGVKPFYEIVGEKPERTVSILGGSGYRLPTEAEWEYACRAGTATDWSFGNDASLLKEYAWYSNNSGYKLQPVGQLKPNSWGLHDMHGNVEEWCWDHYESDYGGELPAIDPTGPTSKFGPEKFKGYRVIRGGSYMEDCSGLRSSMRNSGHPDNKCGIRLVRTSPIDKHFGKAPKAIRTSIAAADSKGAGVPTGELVTNSIGMKLKLIPAGQFLMGFPASDRTKQSDRPQHRVEISQPFLLGVFPVTQDEYVRIMGQNPSQFIGNGRRPVETISWFHAVTFCNLLSEKEGLPLCYKIGSKKVSIIGNTGYRLPTEAEWEYACRAGTTTKWSFGDDESLLHQYAWYKNNAGGETHPVGDLKPNAWGLYDMLGNLHEFCWDWKDRLSEDSVVDPTGPADGFVRVYRGGCFKSHSNVEFQSAYSGEVMPHAPQPVIGFRIAKTLSRT